MRPRRDIDDLDETLFDRDEAAARRAEREERRALAAERNAQMDAQDRAARERVRAFMADTSRYMVLRDYQKAGVEPPTGTLVSLPLLLRLGWRIETMPDRSRQLVAPPVPEPWTGPRDRDSLDERKRK